KESVRTDPPRWPALVGGGLLNVALGTYYAWSVYVPALEKEFGWTRTQTSWVATIDMVMLASSFLLAGFLQNKIGPRAVASIGWRATFQVFAGLFLLFTMAGAYLMKDPPDGYEPPLSTSKATNRPKTHHIEVPTSEMLRMPMFYALWFAYALGTTAGTMVI